MSDDAAAQAASVPRPEEQRAAAVAEAAPAGIANEPNGPAIVPPSAVPVEASFFERMRRRIWEYFAVQEPGFWQAMVPLMLLAIVLYTRLPTTNYIFDEQEALLANPYVNATQGLRFLDAIHRDFWGLPPDRSVGSYRPIPNFFWRSLWMISKQPFFHHFYNVLFHAANGAILCAWTWALSRRRAAAWFSGAVFVACAVLTEAVSGIVGIADVLGGMGALLALVSLRLPAWAQPFGVFAAVLFGLFSKESALVCVPLVPAAAVVLAPLTHPDRPARVVRGLLALGGALAAFVLYVELRKRWFPSPLPSELTQPLPEGASKLQQLARDFLVWFHQAPLPKDPLNNPLAEADTAHRIAGALRVYWRGLVQVVFPMRLSGDYSFPQEPVPDRLVFPESIAGGVMMVLPLLVALGLWIGAMVWERRQRIRSLLVVARGPYREPAAGEPFSLPPSRWMRIAGAALLGLSVGFVLFDFLVLRRRGIVLAVRWVPAWALAAPLALVGLGWITEGGGAAPRYGPILAERPLRLLAPCFVAVGLVWIVVSYFPHSNIPVVLPTVRAERFWYFPAIGSSMVLGIAFYALVSLRRARWAAISGWFMVGAFLLFQCVQAYRHAMDYRDDLTFWEATKKAVPMSAKAHLNFSVMKGARGDLETRLVESKIALALAPNWPMAHIYTGDTLCRMHRPDEAWPYYASGFDIGPNELSLIALALQCLYDEGKLLERDAELRALADKHPGSWIAYLAIDTLDNHEKNKGVNPQYRPRGYNEGPKENEQ